VPQDAPSAAEPHITVRQLTMGYGAFVLMRDLDFVIRRGDIFIIMGGSGSGKTTLFKQMVGLAEPMRGEVLYGDRSFTRAGPEERERMLRGVGILYQQGALWSALTLAENVSLPLHQYTDLRPGEIAELAELKLSLVGLKGFGSYYPAEISGGMRKRAGLARAMALDPEILFFDEPSAGLDPISSKLLDDLIRELRDSLGATIVIVTHELPQLFALGTNGVFLDVGSRTMAASGSPREMLEHCDNEVVQRFLTREGTMRTPPVDSRVDAPAGQGARGPTDGAGQPRASGGEGGSR